MCACHPCAGAMLIFSVSFQFFQMPPEGGPTRIRHARSAEWEHYQSCVNGSDPLSKKSSRSGNRTPGASVTGSNVTNYTNRELALVVHIKEVPLPGFRHRYPQSEARL